MSTKTCKENDNKRVVVTLPGDFKRAKREYKCYPPIKIVITPNLSDSQKRILKMFEFARGKTQQSDKRNMELFKKSLKE